MLTKMYQVDAIWDPAVDRWTATSEDVPGLATEAPSLEALAGKLRDLVPELLEANGLLTDPGAQAIALEITSHRHELIRLAS